MVKVTAKRSRATTTNANSEGSAGDLEEQIRRRAYELYERRGWEDGHEVEDWLQAEAELTRERTKPLAAEAVRKNQKRPVTSAGKTKAKQDKKLRSSVPRKTEEEGRHGH
jgi:hypothetical protein